MRHSFRTGSELSDAPVLNLNSRQDWRSLLSRGIGDLVAGFRCREIWSFLGWREVRKQYQRSVLGPFWLTLNLGILVATLGWFYSQIFGQHLHEFLPYVTVGFIVWGIVSGFFNEACLVFSSSAMSIKQSPLPLSVYPYQLTWRQLVTFAHNLSIYVIVAIVVGLWPGVNGLLAIPGLLLIFVNGFFLCLILGPLAARFRDIPPITASAMQILFFLTPIIWTPANLPDQAMILLLNPFYHFLEIVRQPLLGGTASVLHWAVCGCITLLQSIVALLFFSRFRARIPYWA